MVKYLSGKTLYSSISLVRTRTLEILSSITESLTSTDIDAKIFDYIQDKVLPSTRDKLQASRQYAIRILARLQQPDAESCPVMVSFVNLARYDPCVNVRILALEKVRFSKKILYKILPLLKDKDYRIQQAVFTFLYKRVGSIKHMPSTEHVLNLMSLGFTLKDDTKEHFDQLVMNWFLKLKDQHISVFLKHFDVEENSALCEKIVLRLLFLLKLRPEDALKNWDLVDSISMLLDSKYASNLEKVFYWRMVCEHPYIPKLNCLLDFITENCVDPLITYSKDLTDADDGTEEEVDTRAKLEFCLEQYLHILTNYNYFDSSDKFIVWEFLMNILQKVHFTGLTINLWKTIGILYESLFKKSDDQLIIAIEFVNELLETKEDTDEASFEDARVKLQYLQLNDELENASDIDAKRQIMQQIESLRISIENQLEKEGKIKKKNNPCKVRNLFKTVEFINMVVSLFKIQETKANSRAMRSINQWGKEIVDNAKSCLETAEFPCFRHAVCRAFSLCGCFSLTQAKKAMTLFCAQLKSAGKVEEENYDSIIVMIGGITDFLKCHGEIDLIDFDQDIDLNSTSSGSPRQIFLKRLGDTFYDIYSKNRSTEVGKAALTGIVQLFLSGFLKSHMKLFAKMLMILNMEETSLVETKMVSVFLQSTANDVEMQRNLLVKPFISLVKSVEEEFDENSKMSYVNSVVNLVGDELQVELFDEVMNAVGNVGGEILIDGSENAYFKCGKF